LRCSLRKRRVRTRGRASPLLAARLRLEHTLDTRWRVEPERWLAPELALRSDMRSIVAVAPMSTTSTAITATTAMIRITATAAIMADLITVLTMALPTRTDIPPDFKETAIPETAV